MDSAATNVSEGLATEQMPADQDGEVMDDLAGEADALEPLEDDEGEDLLDGAERDYVARPELDKYESQGIDDDSYEELSAGAEFAARRAAEEAMDRRERRARLPGAFDEDEGDYQRPHRRQRVEDDDEEDVDVEVDLNRQPTGDWLAQEAVVQAIRKKFYLFLRTYKDENNELVYRTRIDEMCKVNSQSLEVDFKDLTKTLRFMGAWLVEKPKLILDTLNSGLVDAVLKDYPQYQGISTQMFVRLANLPLDDRIRDLRHWHLNTLVRVRGVVTRRTGVFPQLREVMYDCPKCGFVAGPFIQNGEAEVRPATCVNCQSKGPFQVNSSRTLYRNYQKLTLQESPGSVSAGRLPRHKEVVLLNDLIDCARPGEEVEVTGTYQCGYDAGLNMRNSFPVFSTHIEANHISKQESIYSAQKLTDEDKAEIMRLGREKDVGKRIARSIAPSIYGHEDIKMALALALFGGQPKHATASHRMRGDINVLLLGDPGTAKSQFLKYIEKTATRAVFTTGKGASAVGLTAGVHKDPITKEWTLEGGALVLADRGVCLIDEFDKMNDQDRVSIHEAMEQQSISISKAGIVTQLQARCSVVAAANPVGGRYDPSRTFAENVELTDPILSRFDVLCVVRDVVDSVADRRLAEFVVGTHAASHGRSQPLAEQQPGGQGAGGATQGEQRSGSTLPEMLPQELLRKYIIYAKQQAQPVLQPKDYERIVALYSDLRREASKTHGMPIAVRHLESLIRLSEAHARMHLRLTVNDDDISVASSIMVNSFISTQKYSVHTELQRRFRRYVPVPAQERNHALLRALRTLLREEQRARIVLGRGGDEEEGAAAAEVYHVARAALDAAARELNLNSAGVDAFLRDALFQENGFELQEDGRAIVYRTVAVA